MQSPRKQLSVLLAVVFFGFFGLSIPYAIFPSLFLGANSPLLTSPWMIDQKELLLGITLAAYPFGQFLGSPIIGTMADLHSRKKIMVTTLLLTATCNLLTALSLSHSFLGLLICSRFFAGFMEGNLAIARAMAADIKALNKHKTFGKIDAASSIAFLIGPMAGGILSDNTFNETFSSATPFQAIFFLFLVLSAAAKFALQDRQIKNSKEHRSLMERFNLKARLKELFQNRRLKYLLLISTLYTLSVDMFYEFGPVYLTAKWLLEPKELALYSGALSLTLSIGSGWVAAAAAARYDTNRILLYTISSLGTMLVMMLYIDTPWAMAALFATMGISIGISTTHLAVLISNAAEDEVQGEVMGVKTSLRVLGNAAICLLGGVLMSLTTDSVVLITAILAFLALAYSIKKKDMIVEFS